MITKLYRILASIIFFLFPYFRLRAANNKIEQRIKQIDDGVFEDNLSYVAGYGDYTLKDILPFYEKTLETKKSLEDKAKISVVSITILTTLVVGLTANLVKARLDFHSLSLFCSTLLTLCVLIIIYVDFSCILAINLLGNKNKVYQLFPPNTKLSDNKKANYLTIYTEQNANLNIIRSNYLFCSFQHLVHAIICMSLLFFVILIANGDESHSADVLGQTKNSYLEISHDKTPNLKVSFDSLQLRAIENINQEFIIKTFNEFNQQKSRQLDSLNKKIAKIEKYLQITPPHVK